MVEANCCLVLRIQDIFSYISFCSVQQIIKCNSDVVIISDYSSDSMCCYIQRILQPQFNPHAWRNLSESTVYIRQIHICGDGYPIQMWLSFFQKWLKYIFSLENHRLVDQSTKNSQHWLLWAQQSPVGTLDTFIPHIGNRKNMPIRRSRVSSDVGQSVVHHGAVYPSFGLTWQVSPWTLNQANFIKTKSLNLCLLVKSRVFDCVHKTLMKLWYSIWLNIGRQPGGVEV